MGVRGGTWAPWGGSCRATWRRKRWVLIVAAAAALASLVGMTAVAGAATGGSISGTVTNAAGSPLQGVNVLVLQASGEYWSEAGSASTASDGTYSVGGLSTGTYRVRFVGSEQFLPQFYDDESELEAATDVSVTEGQATSGIDARMEELGHISGRVTNAAGEPLEGVTFRLYPFPEHLAGNAETDASGYYDFSVEPGSYAVMFWDGYWSASGGAYAPEFYSDKTTQETADLVTVTSGGTTSGIDAVLATLATVSGRVTDAQGQPLAGIAVYAAGATLFNGIIDNDDAATTDADGRYAIGLRASSTVRMQFWDPGGVYREEWYDDASTQAAAAPIEVMTGQTIEGIDAVLTKADSTGTGSITGTVRDAHGDGIPWAEVFLSGAADQKTWTDEAGSYRFSGLLPGTYKVRFYGAIAGDYLSYWFDGHVEQAGWGGYDNAALADPVVVTEGLTTPGIDGVLGAAGHITGMVTNGSGAGLSGVEVHAWVKLDGSWWEQWLATSGEDGTYDLGHLPTANYRLQFVDPSETYPDEWHDNAATIGAAGDIAVTAGETTSGIDAILGEEPPPSDVTAPITTASGADALWHNAPVIVTLSAVDDAGGSGMSGGAAKTEYRLDAGAWTTGTSCVVPAPADHSGDGEHSVLYRSTDAAGNTEVAKSVTVRIDTTPPSGSFTLNAGAATTASPTVSGGSSVTDAHGPLELRFSVDDKATWSAWGAYASTTALTLPGGAGEKTVYAQYRDAAGNLRELSDAIIYVPQSDDETAPSVEATGAADGAWYRRAVQVTLTATDEPGGSGVASITYTLDGVETTVPAASALVSIAALPNAAHLLTFHATDGAGNAGSDQMLSFTIDTTGPATYAKATGGRTRRAIALRYKIDDNLSPKATSIRIVVKNRRGVTVKTLRPTTRSTATWYSAKWTPKTKSTYRYYVYAKDLAGNPQRLRGSATVVVR